MKNNSRKRFIRDIYDTIMNSHSMDLDAAYNPDHERTPEEWEEFYQNVARDIFNSLEDKGLRYIEVSVKDFED